MCGCGLDGKEVAEIACHSADDDLPRVVSKKWAIKPVCLKLVRLAIINGKAVPAAEQVSIEMKTNTMSSGAA